MLRVPCIYDATAAHEQRVRTALATALRRILARVRQQRQPYARFSRAWRSVAPDLAGSTSITGFSDGRLDVAVVSSAHRAELQGFRAPQLLAALQATPDGRDVTDLRFTLQEVHHDRQTRRTHARSG